MALLCRREHRVGARALSIRVFLAGEGPTELGSWSREPPHRDPPRVRGLQPPAIGLLEALANKLGASIEIVDAVLWKKIRKYRAGDHASAEHRNVLGVAEMARDAGAEVILFVRDRDGDESRGRDIEAAIPVAESIHDMPIAGGVAIEEIEAWLLALLGERGSEKHGKPKEVLEARGHDNLEQKLAIIYGCDLPRVPGDAGSLTQWLARCRAALRLEP